jgi:hypothetical protein
MRWTEHIAFIGGMRDAYEILVEETSGKRLFVRHESTMSVWILKQCVGSEFGYCRTRSIGGLF